jgi:hypothetical protein
LDIFPVVNEVFFIKLTDADTPVSIEGKVVSLPRSVKTVKDLY